VSIPETMIFGYAVIMCERKIPQITLSGKHSFSGRRASLRTQEVFPFFFLFPKISVHFLEQLISFTLISSALIFHLFFPAHIKWRIMILLRYQFRVKQRILYLYQTSYKIFLIPSQSMKRYAFCLFFDFQGLWLIYFFL